MPTASEVRDKLSELNRVDILPQPEEITRIAESNLIYIYNVSPYSYTIQHPLIGRLTIPACPEGKKYSEPAILKGLIPYGVREQMTSAELRHQSGRELAVDLLGIGPFKQPANSMLNWGVFIAADDTFDSAKSADIKTAPNTYLSLPAWVKNGKLGKVPTEKEIRKANELFEKTDFSLIAEADGFANQGPQALINISSRHREALRRRGQQRPWDAPLQTMIDCPGCQAKIAPGSVVHTCGAVLNWEKAIELGIKKESDRPAKKA